MSYKILVRLVPRMAKVIFAAAVFAAVFQRGVATAHAAAAGAEVPASLIQLLSRPVVATNQTWRELQTYLESRIPEVPPLKSVREWRRDMDALRRRVLDEVVLRGDARTWAAASCGVEWGETIPGGPGYRITKLRYEVIPGMWIPALLYEPDKVAGRVPVALAVNGHDALGKAAPYKQIRCINMVKRGMIVLNIEWFNMGQLRGEQWDHYKMNQLDLCGSSGLAPFYLAMRRGIDLLLAMDNTDPARVAVSGLSGGGWQTAFISGIDPRVTLANPVAGYSSFKTRVRFTEDLGDSEQTPADLATVLDYTHLTAMRAPRPTLLTFNAYDTCCFAAGHAMGPLVAAAEPAFRMQGAPGALRTHINFTPGNHNYERENREVYYQMLGDFFFRDQAGFSAEEIPSDDELKTAEQLNVPMPADNKSFQMVAVDLAKSLPKGPLPPERGPVRERWQTEGRARLARIVRAQAMDSTLMADFAWRAQADGVDAEAWRLRLAGTWSVPVIEMARVGARESVLVIADAGRVETAPLIQRYLKQRKRVFLMDPFYFGDCRLPQRDFLYALLLSAVGDRALGIQGAQVAAVSRWISGRTGNAPVSLHAVGPRMSLVGLVAGALEIKSIGSFELEQCLPSLRDVITSNLGVNQKPELFCFGLLESFDIPQMAALLEPRPVRGIEGVDQRP